MSFASDVKTELARIEESKKCCSLAWIAGFVRMCGNVVLLGGGRLQLKVVTEDPAVARLFLKQVKSYFTVGAGLEISENQSSLSKKAHVYTLILNSEDNAEQILRETGILTVKEGCNVFSLGIFEPIIKKKCCRKAYLRGAFLGAGTLCAPEKSYQLDISCNNIQLGQDMRRLVNSFGLRSKVAERRNNYVVYLKEAEQISDLLTLMGAHSSVLAFENVRVQKELRNAANRKVNCDAANLDKTVNTALRQISDIQLIRDKEGLDHLPEGLRNLAELRLAHPDASLTELGDLLEPPLKKSGVNHRFQKLAEIAAKYRNEE